MAITKRAMIGHEAVAVTVDAELEKLADWLLGVLARMHQTDHLVEDGKRIQLGWSVLVFRRQSNGTLLVCEPDFMRDPFTDEVPNANYSLRLQAVQMAFADRAGVSPEVTRFQEKIILEKGCLEENAIYMTREPPQREKADSGWFIGVRRPNEATAELEAIYAFQLLRDRPSLFPALILPAGFMVVAGPDGVESVLNASNELIMHC
ncbi:hypothetical protein SAMN02745857_04381 [Andreprevotia lacus DSM 23236]|jgi:hypothetical protein|uniref:Imm33-like domain-containing protein n=1 Tax=Andreprevotia lacus DSM 23236 TaxID=1121001 RepID=A0A1W1Y1K2_9NEIS|nr:hypothetical protein [Andreprevotia lacus]SMC30033.1 hypothetical protein SAMN02745857_04381 [Andreprevotia lacus DSM 23236]